MITRSHAHSDSNEKASTNPETWTLHHHSEQPSPKEVALLLTRLRLIEPTRAVEYREQCNLQRRTRIVWPGDDWTCRPSLWLRLASAGGVRRDRPHERRVYAQYKACKVNFTILYRYAHVEQFISPCLRPRRLVSFAGATQTQDQSATSSRIAKYDLHGVRLLNTFL